MEKSIEEIDKNFKLTTSCGKEVKWYDCKESFFGLTGITWSDEDKTFLRIPRKVAESVSEGVCNLCSNTAGGKLRFSTDSPYVVIKPVYGSLGKMGHFAPSGSIGFDLYNEDNPDDIIYLSTFIPPYNLDDSYESLQNISSDGLFHQYHINFPTYSSVAELQIGIAPDSSFGTFDDFDEGDPIVFYGSSITQGGCCTRPGNAYPSILSRKLKRRCTNLGFSGNAMGETAMAEYIAGLKMSAFVFDYDHNAPTNEHLKNTHQPMFELIRKNNPNLPILMLTRPRANNCQPFELERIEIIRKTYSDAIAKGDKNVRFLDMSGAFCRFGGDGCTVDNCHPNDMGFMCMAECVFEELNKML